MIPGLGSSPGEGNGNPLQYSCLENPMDRGLWQAIVHGVSRVGHDLATKLLLVLLCCSLLIFYSLIFSRFFFICASILFFCASILFPNFWIIFAIIFLSSLSGRWLISYSFVWFCGLFCFPLIYPMLLYLLILFNLLSLLSPFCSLDGQNSS